MNPSGREIQVVGLFKTDLGRTCYIHPDGCGRGVKRDDHLLFRIEEIEVDLVKRASKTTKKRKKEVEDMVSITTEITIIELNKYTVPMLKASLKKFGLPGSGNKAALVQRIFDHILAEQQHSSEESDEQEGLEIAEDDEVETQPLSTSPCPVFQESVGEVTNQSEFHFKCILLTKYFTY